MSRNEAEQKVRTIRIDIEEDVKRGTYATIEEGLTAKLIEALMMPTFEHRKL